MSDTQHYKTTDLPVAAALMTAGLTFLGTEGEDPRRLKFVFMADDRTQDLESRYYDGTLETRVVPFVNSFRTLKGIIGRRREQGNG